MDIEIFHYTDFFGSYVSKITQGGFIIMVLLVIGAFGILYLIRLPALLQKGYRRDLAVFTVLMSIAFVYSLLLALGVKLPYIGTEITKLFKTVFKIS